MAALQDGLDGLAAASLRFAAGFAARQALVKIFQRVPHRSTKLLRWLGGQGAFGESRLYLDRRSERLRQRLDRLPRAQKGTRHDQIGRAWSELGRERERLCEAARGQGRVRLQSGGLAVPNQEQSPHQDARSAGREGAADGLDALAVGAQIGIADA
jgi:hypothetical protein